MPILPEANLELRQDKKWVFNEQKIIDIERRIIDNPDYLKFENHEGIMFFLSSLDHVFFSFYVCPLDLEHVMI